MKTQKNSKLISESRRNLYNTYHSKVVPILNELERERKSKLILLVCCELFVACLLFVTGSYLMTYQKNAATGSGEVLVAFLCCYIICGFVTLLFYLPAYFNSNFIKNLKRSCMPKILSIFESLRWDCYHNVIPDIKMLRSQLFGRYLKRDIDDSFWGVYKDVPFNIVETRLYKLVSRDNRGLIPIFKGVVITFEVNKNIQNTTIVATKHDTKIRNDNKIKVVPIICLACCWWIIKPTNLLDLFEPASITVIIFVFLIPMLFCFLFRYLENKDILGLMKFLDVLDEMKLEDPEFNKRYKAYSSDQVEGRYLITPAFIERFNNLQTAFGANKAKCSFYGNEIMFAISTNKNLFEIGNLFQNLNHPKQIEVFFKELSSILALIDYFKLDEKTGL